jgi:hypothetical protein
MNFASFPNARSALKQPPPVNDPPSVAEVARTVEITSMIKRQRFEDPSTVTDQNLCDAVMFEKQVQYDK